MDLLFQVSLEWARSRCGAGLSPPFLPTPSQSTPGRCVSTARGDGEDGRVVAIGTGRKGTIRAQAITPMHRVLLQPCRVRPGLCPWRGALAASKNPLNNN